ncbi:MAG TPA: RHS repeat-associated core domain-containing protein [Mycobacteriales bacterium]|nr:RHS repeat-associated core domain-containing protein [Mycobacteriales bacterium]
MTAVSRRRVRPVAAGSALALVAALLAVLPAGPASAVPTRPPRPALLPSVPGSDATARLAPVDPTKNVTTPARATFPAAGSADVALPAAATGVRPDAGPVRPAITWAAGLPIGAARTAAPAGAGPQVAAPTRLRLRLLDPATARHTGHDMVLRAARIDGTSTPGKATIAVNYGGFRTAYGADWARRLTLVALPDCALTTPAERACQATPLPTSNDTVHSALSTVVTVTTSGTMVALAAGASSDGGDYKATDLKEAGNWAAGDNSGGFAWGLPLRVPPSLGGPAPKVQLAYSSQAVDGQTAASNSQPSWIGEGFAWQPGSIERGYRGCNDDGGASTNGDLCWAGDNASLTLNGRSTQLVLDSGGQWRPKDEDGSKIEHLTGGVNGDNDGEYWKVTATDGTQYFFGRNRLPGWRSGTDPETNSVFYEPVYGNNGAVGSIPAEPCHSDAGFGSSSCQQGYRWNLDYVVDPHGNTMSLFYQREMNSYSRNHVDADVSSYVRGGWLAEIDYGTRQDAGVDSVFAGTAPARVLFDTTDRCVIAGPTCTLTTANAGNWPDLPVDQICTGTTCANHYSPTFFTQKKLSAVTTQVATGNKTWRRVEQWRLTQVFKDPGDGLAKILWLSSLAHCGTDDTTCMPSNTFIPTQLSNRVDLAGTTNSIIRYRMSSIQTESGGLISIAYSAPECVAGSNMPAAADSNTKRCFPVWWVPPGSTVPKLEYFHKYVVSSVALGDLVGGNPDEVTYYTYLDSPAWYYDDNPLAISTRHSWSQWRGYSQVRVVHGANTETQSKTEITYFRGMDADRTASGTRSVSISDTDGGSWVDSNWFAGTARETVTYLGTTSTVVSKTKNDPYQFGPTATQTLNGVTLTAYATDTAVVTTKTTLDGNRGFRTTRASTSFTPDRSARVSQTDDEGDLSTTADDRCARTSYAADAATTMLTFVTRVETVGVTCSATPNRSRDVLMDVRTWYDGASSFGGTVSKGDPTKVEQLADWNGGNPVYKQTERTSYDAYGRPLDSYDALDRKTSTVYTPASGAAATSTTVTDPKNFAATTTTDVAWGLDTSRVDANGRRADLAYDGLGRLTGVWLPGRDKATQTPDQKYAYTLRTAGGPSVVATSKLNAAGTGYTTSYLLYDGWLRERQTQAPAVGGGRLITDTMYDSRGLVAKNRPAYFNSNAPATAVFLPTGDNAVPAQSVTGYDGAERVTTVITQVDAVEKWRSTTSYGGDHTDLSVPLGGTATSTWADARGQTTAVWHYHGNTAAGAHDVTTRGYTPAGDLNLVVDAAGSRWSATYDQRRRKLTSTDPNTGTSTFSYDEAGQQLTTTDARGGTLAYSYDELGRKTGEFVGSPSGTKLAAWAYDTLPGGKRQIASTTRYDGAGNAYVTGPVGYTAHYQPTGTVVTLPAAAGVLAGTYTTSTTYNADGTVHTDSTPAKSGSPGFGGLPDETLSYGYNDLGMPTTLTGLSSYVTDTQYLQTGQLSSVDMTDGGGKDVLQYWTYEHGTSRMVEHQVVGDFATVVATETHYTYDPAGNVTGVADKLAQYGAGADDNQCLRYDYLQRLTEAWTPTSGDCTAAPTTAGLGGLAPYWTTYAVDASGNRTSVTEHAASGNRVGTYNYPAASAARPHAVTSVTGAGAATYGYDPDGNTTSRKVAGKPDQTLTWDAEGHLATLVDSAGTTTYTYTAGGMRLLAKDPSGATLWLGATECRAVAGGTVSCTRPYGFGTAGTVGVRTPAGLSWASDDHQGTSQLLFRASDLAITRRRATPFGADRGPAVAWPASRGFVGGVDDDRAGLVHIGARDYDPVLGRFTSVDPQFAIDDPQSWNGYSYADNTPVTASDPTGERTEDQYYGPGGKDKDNSAPAPEGNYSGPCDGSHSASNCDSHGKTKPDRPHKPKDVMRRTVFGKGTVLIVHYDGTVSINGYILPAGIKDPDKLAAAVDAHYKPFGDGQPPDLIETTGLLQQSCNPELCTLDQKNQVDRAHNLALDMPSGPVDMHGWCLGGASGFGMGTAGSACVVSDNHGWAITLNWTPVTLTTPGAFLGVGPTFSNGDIDAQKGAFLTVDVGAGEVVGVDSSYAYAGGILTTTDLFGGGVGSPVTAAGGVSYTWIPYHHRNDMVHSLTPLHR